MPDQYSCVPSVRAQLNSQREAHRLVEVDDPVNADIILFTECQLLPSDWRMNAISRSEIARAFPHTIAVYDERDRPWSSLPGIYVSMPRRAVNPTWQVAGSYWHIDQPADRLGPGYVAPGHPQYLYSFVGSPTHKCRRSIFSLPASGRARVVRIDDFLFYDSTPPRFEERRQRFAGIVFESSFVLCPRGRGLSSIRLYEVLAAGRVPVIIADDWVAPTGPDWPSCSLRWPESRIAELPAERERLEPKAHEMGRVARLALEAWFATDVALTVQIGQLAALLATNSRQDFPSRRVRDAYFRKVRKDEFSISSRQRLVRMRRKFSLRCPATV